MNTTPGAVFTTLHFFVTHEWAQLARALHKVRVERPASEKHSSLLGQFISYEEKSVVNTANRAVFHFLHNS